MQADSFSIENLEFKDAFASFEPSPYIEFHGHDNGMLVRINVETGEVEFGEHYTPSAAAEVFWTVLARCPKCNS